MSDSEKSPSSRSFTTRGEACLSEFEPGGTTVIRFFNFSLSKANGLFLVGVPGFGELSLLLAVLFVFFYTNVNKFPN